MVLLAVVLASVAAVYFTEMKVKHAREDFADQDKELKEARIKLQKSGEEREIILRYRGGYEQLTRAGFTNCFNILEGFEGDKDAQSRRIVSGWKAAGLPWEQ